MTDSDSTKMIVTRDERVTALLIGEDPAGVQIQDLSMLRDAICALNAISRVEDVLYIGSRVLRVIVNRRRRYFVDVGSSHWITFEWRVPDAINVRLLPP